MLHDAFSLRICLPVVTRLAKGTIVNKWPDFSLPLDKLEPKSFKGVESDVAMHQPIVDMI